MIFAKHPDQIEAQRMGFGCCAALVGARLGAGRGYDKVRIVDRIAGAIGRLRDMETERWKIAPLLASFCPCPDHFCASD